MAYFIQKTSHKENNYLHIKKVAEILKKGLGFIKI